MKIGHILTVARALCAITILLCLVGAGCPGPDPELPPPNVEHGIFTESATGPFVQDQFYGCSETFTLPVSIALLPGEQAGQMVTVTVTGYDGATVSPASRQVPLPAAGMRTYLSFQVTTGPNPSPGSTSFLAARTRSGTATGTDPNEVEARAGYYAIRNLARLTLTPSTSSIVRGGSQTFTASILPRGIAEGHVEFDVSLYNFGPEVTVEPTTLSADLVRGSTTPIDRTVIVRATSTAGLGQGSLLFQQLNVFSRPVNVRTATIRIITGTNPPDFTLTATPTALTIQNGVESSTVLFTLTSVNGFDGVVTMTRDSDGESQVNPGDNYFPITVRPGAPGRFARTFIRWFGTDPIHVTFKGHSQLVQQDKEVVITLNYAP